MVGTHVIKKDLQYESLWVIDLFLSFIPLLSSVFVFLSLIIVLNMHFFLFEFVHNLTDGFTIPTIYYL